MKQQKSRIDEKIDHHLDELCSLGFFDGDERNQDAPDPRRPTNGNRVARGDGLRAEPSDYGWHDREGRPVPVLRASQRLADHLPDSATTDAIGVGFGDCLRALALGPRSEAERRALEEGTDSAGGFTVPAPVASEYIDRLRARSSVMAAGARTVPMDTNSLQIARLDTDPSFSFKGENSQMSDNSPTFGAVTFATKTSVSLVRASQELIEDSVNVNDALMNAFAAAGALEVDRVALRGTGTSNEPRGALNTTGINSVNIDSSPDYDDMLDGMFELENDDVPMPYAVVLNPRDWKTLRKLKSNDGEYLMPPAAFQDVAKFSSTQLPVEGGSPDSSDGVIGHFPHLFIGMRRQLTVRTLTERYADFLQIGFVAYLRFDIQLAHTASFCALRGMRA